MELKATLETRVSTKNGKEYTVIVIDLPYGLKKKVFLEEAELKLLQLAKTNENNDDEMPFLG